MAKHGPIIIIEDDHDDQEIMTEVMQELEVTSELILFDNSIKAFEYLKTTTESPFLIFCDVNLPIQNGIEFKRNIDNDPQLRRKSIPFVFLSTSVNQSAVNEAYTQMTVQGFFQKPGNFQAVKDLVKRVLDYWNDCSHPNAG